MDFSDGQGPMMFSLIRDHSRLWSYNLMAEHIIVTSSA